MSKLLSYLDMARGGGVTGTGDRLGHMVTVVWYVAM